MSFASSHSICTSFRDLAAWTWRKIQAASELGVAFGEETITESLLLKLAERHAGRGFRIRAYTKPEEGRGTAATGGLPTGADWAFWFASPSGKGIELRIQAKRQFPSGQYKSLDGNGQQIRDLAANCGRAIPMYVLYNGPSNFDARGAQWSRLACSSGCSPRFRGQSTWGCAVAPVSAIPAKSGPFPSELKPLRPWHCLVCECSGSQPGAGSLPDKVARLANGLYRYPSVSNGGSDDNTTFEPHDEVPEWVGWLKRSENAEPNWADFWERTGLAGVALIQETNENHHDGYPPREGGR
jgi:hypothetical protein